MCAQANHAFGAVGSVWTERREMIWNCSPWQRKSSGHWALIMCVMFALYPLSMATTIITNTRSEIAFMAGLWVADTIPIFRPGYGQYPPVSYDCRYKFSSRRLSAYGGPYIAFCGGSIRYRS